MKINFAKNLRELRQLRGLRQLDLAQKCKMTQRKISYLESGKTEPNLEDLWNLADFFDVSIDVLVGRKEY